MNLKEQVRESEEVWQRLHMTILVKLSYLSVNQPPPSCPRAPFATSLLNTRKHLRASSVSADSTSHGLSLKDDVQSGQSELALEDPELANSVIQPDVRLLFTTGTYTKYQMLLSPVLNATLHCGNILIVPDVEKTKGTPNICSFLFFIKLKLKRIFLPRYCCLF